MMGGALSVSVPVAAATTAIVGVPPAASHLTPGILAENLEPDAADAGQPGESEVAGQHDRRPFKVDVVDRQHAEPIGAGHPPLPLGVVQCGILRMHQHVSSPDEGRGWVR